MNRRSMDRPRRAPLRPAASGRPRRAHPHPGVTALAPGLAGLALALLLSTGSSTLAEPQKPAPPRSRVEVYDPDTLTCKPEAIAAAYRSQLAPWKDQPEEVQQRLRILQGEMTRSSLRRCLDKGLLTPEQVAALQRELGLTSQPGPRPPQTGGTSGTRP